MGFYFGMIIGTPTGLATVAYILVIVFLILFERFTELLKLLPEASYEMVQAVFKELMIMGVVSFIIVMIQTDQDLGAKHQNWLKAIENAHIPLFFMTLFYVMHAAFIIISTSFTTKLYNTYYFREVKDIVSSIDDVHASPFRRFWYNQAYLPGSAVQKCVQFKLNCLYFHDRFQIPSDFNIARYVIASTEKYTLRLLEISATNKFILMVFIVLNYIRIIIMAVSVDDYCLSHQDSLTRRLGGGSGPSHVRDLSPSCVDFSLRTFTVAGYALIVWTVILRVLARVFEMRLTKCAGGYTIQDYRGALLRIHEGLSSRSPFNNRNLLAELKENIEHLVEEFEKSEKGLESYIMKTIQSLEERFFVMSSSAPKPTAVMPMDGVLPMHNSTSTSHHVFAGGEEALHEKAAEEALKKVHNSELELSKNVFFGFRELYFKCVELTLMLNCLWLAIWATNFISAAVVSDHSSFWNGLMIVPVLLVMPVLLGVIETTAKLSAFTRIDFSAMGNLLEVADEVKELKLVIRNKLNKHLAMLQKERVIDRLQFVNELVATVDLADSSGLSVVEFKRLLQMLGVSFSTATLSQLFDAIDVLKDENITVQELQDFLEQAEEEAEAEEGNQAAEAVRRRSSASKSTHNHLA